MSQQFRFKNIDKIRNYFLEEIMQNELMSRKHKQLLKEDDEIKEEIKNLKT